MTVTVRGVNIPLCVFSHTGAEWIVQARTMGERLGDDIVVEVDMGAVWLRRVVWIWTCGSVPCRETKGAPSTYVYAKHRMKGENKRMEKDREVCHTLVRGKARRG